MTSYWFPDNTVICNFASVDRITLLETILNGRGRWTEAVAHEVQQSATIALPALKPAEVRRWLGEPIEIEEDEAGAIETIRVSIFGGPTTSPRKNLGEAQTLHVITTRAEFNDATWISDDRAALDYARRNRIRVMETAGVMAQGCVMGDVVHTEAYRLLRSMIALGNRVRIPENPTDLLR